jgi:trk system potassium uptake protein
MSPIFGSSKQAQLVHRQVRARTLSISIPGREPVRFSPGFFIFVFLALVIIGMVLLYPPISSADGKSTSIIDWLFTSVSAVCVTGLIVFDTSTHWSLFGQIIILLLIQIGGFGIMTGTTLISLLFGRKVGLN